MKILWPESIMNFFIDVTMIDKRNNSFKHIAKTAINRSAVYGILSEVYRSEPTASLMNQINDPWFQRVLYNLGVRFEKKFFDRTRKNVLEDLAIEYTRLFLGPGEHISPHESIHHERDDGDWGILWGASTYEVRKFYNSTGVMFETTYHGIPDEISVELEFMHHVVRREADAWKETNNEGALFCIRIEKKFIKEHLLEWVPIFCNRVIDLTQSVFYREIARLTKDFVLQEINLLNNKAFSKDRKSQCALV